MMLECWRHSAARRPSFIQLLDQLAADLSDEFHNVSYYFNHEPDYDDAASDSGSTDGRIVSTEEVNETIPFRATSSGQLKVEPSSSAADSKVSSSQNLCTPKEPQSHGFVGCSSMERKPRNAEFIEMSGQLTTATADSTQSSLLAVHEGGLHRNTQQDSQETGTSCQNVGDSESKDSSGSSVGSCKNGLINGHIIPRGTTLHSEVH